MTGTIEKEIADTGKLLEKGWHNEHHKGFLEGKLQFMKEWLADRQSLEKKIPLFSEELKRAEEFDAMKSEIERLKKDKIDLHDASWNLLCAKSHECRDKEKCIKQLEAVVDGLHEQLGDKTCTKCKEGELGKEDVPALTTADARGIKFDFWPCPRPMTRKWGSGQVFDRISRYFGLPDVAFGKTDGIPENIKAVDLNNGYDWKKLPFKDNEFEFGYWDPPYDKLYKKEGQEIWRTCKKIAILHTFIFPKAWLKDAERIGMVAITFGPLKQIRCLQIFKKKEVDFFAKKGVNLKNSADSVQVVHNLPNDSSIVLKPSCSNCAKHNDCEEEKEVIWCNDWKNMASGNGTGGSGNSATVSINRGTSRQKKPKEAEG